MAPVCGTAFANREVNLNFKKLKDLKEFGFRNKLIIKKNIGDYNYDAD